MLVSPPVSILYDIGSISINQLAATRSEFARSKSAMALMPSFLTQGGSHSPLL